MNKELVDKLADYLGETIEDGWGEDVTTQDAKNIITFLNKQGYVIIKKDDLIKEAGLIVAEKLGVE